MKKFFLQHKTLIYALVLFFLSCGVYANCLGNNFVWDDVSQIAKNQLLGDRHNLPMILTSGIFYNSGVVAHDFYRPLMNLSHFLNYSAWGPNPLGFHLPQIIFHALNVILVFFIFKKIFANHRVKGGEDMSFLAALLFAVHPANVESVSFIASIGEILYVFFSLAGILFFVSGIDYEKKTIKNNYLLLSFIFIFIGFFGKESAVIALVIPLFYLFIFVRPKFQAYLNYVFGVAIVVDAYCFIRFVLIKLTAPGLYTSLAGSLDFRERLLTSPYALISYLKIIFFPKDLLVDRQFAVYSLSDPRFWGSVTVLFAILSVLAWYIWKKKDRVVFFLALWFFLSIGFVVNVFPPLSMSIAERWLYFPLIGICALAGYGFISLKNRLGRRWLVVELKVLAVLVIALFGFRTMVRNTDWKDSLTLFGHAVFYSPENVTAINNFAIELWRSGRLDEAEAYLLKSLQIDPVNPYGHNNMGLVYEKREKYLKALEEYKLSIEQGGEINSDPYQNLAVLFYKLGEFDRSRAILKEAIRLFPHMSHLKYLLAKTYEDQGDKDSAASLMSEFMMDEKWGEAFKGYLEDKVIGR